MFDAAYGRPVPLRHRPVNRHRNAQVRASGQGTDVGLTPKRSIQAHNATDTRGVYHPHPSFHPN
ncbi:hypothetical protein XFF6166_490078 [Xanthomonas citri pv. fuscans]|uniref:Uncharacterized protein n=1 Tax=Xanthomonas campestris pv. phaseoli TaxID=317013 RepID=A0AB38E167_XANCH|nr:hypothetical protein XFF6166_490078 [Xanthomonas citri pv. fuscans]SON81753.1 hypothetical protein XAP6984_420124 [Xanthomonas phaseoli pv. phaseoli]SON84660.1 hypothetical protein XAP412_370073 [Xanthomonas phaseoli pv. phaseoli]SON89058.1 hypothetical protein XAP7430_400141 [Xanthomonas phaseoli pv. phaseoli]SOO00972.1 hypothetical protein XFF7767_1080104 [Xanthomonas citri pv. fuscans]